MGSDKDETIIQNMLGVNMALPQGTREELLENGLDPATVGSCSAKGRGNVGCPVFDKCRFPQWRDGLKGLKGPLNVGVRKILGPSEGGLMQEFQVQCFDWFRSGFAAQQKDMETTGQIVQVVAYEGDGKTIKERCTRPDTRKGAPPNRTETYIDEHEVIPFVRPADKFAGQRMAKDARAEMMIQDEREALHEALAAHGAKKAVKEQ